MSGDKGSVAHFRDHYLPPDHDEFRRAEPPTGRVIVIAPTRAACETIELAMQLDIPTVLETEHGPEIRDYARQRVGFGIVAGTGTGKTLAIQTIAREMLGVSLKVGVVNREREATPQTPTWNVVIVTTGIARRWFQSELILKDDTIIVDEIHQTSAELELCLALGKRVGCRFVWLSATVDPAFYREYLDSTHVLHTTAFDPTRAANVITVVQKPFQFLGSRFLRKVANDRRGVAVFLPTRAETEQAAEVVSERNPRIEVVYYHGGEPIRVVRPFLDGTAPKPFVLTMTAAGQSALNIQGLDTVVIYDAQYKNIVQGGRNVLTRKYLGANEILQMAGRVHGRVKGGQVVILTDRDIDFESLRPVPPEFQLAGDTERVALTAAAIGVDLTELELPVPLDRGAYRRAMTMLVDRGIVHEGRLTAYGRDVEAMPVDRAWGELLVTAPDDLTHVVAVAANIDSLHRMTRDERNLTGLVVDGSDHLTAYNLFADAVNRHGSIGQVFGLPRHVFDPDVEIWADERGVLVKAVEDVALGLASIYRTLELSLPESLPLADAKTLRQFRALLAEVMPLDLVIDEETARGESVRVSRGSMANKWGIVAGTIRYFADRRGVTRGSIEGSSLPASVVNQFARTTDGTVEYRRSKRSSFMCQIVRREYFGFHLERSDRKLSDPFPKSLLDASRNALTAALIAGQTDHHDQRGLLRCLDQLGEYWRRSGAQLAVADPAATRGTIRKQLDAVDSLSDFHETRIGLAIDEMISADEQERLDALPASAHIRGDTVPLLYEIEDGESIVRLVVRMGQARRIQRGDLPEVDRPLRFTVTRGKNKAIRAVSLEDLHRKIEAVPRRQPSHRRSRRSRRR